MTENCLNLAYNKGPDALVEMIQALRRQLAQAKEEHEAMREALLAIEGWAVAAFGYCNTLTTGNVGHKRLAIRASFERIRAKAAEAAQENAR